MIALVQDRHPALQRKLHSEIGSEVVKEGSGSQDCIASVGIVQHKCGGWFGLAGWVPLDFKGSQNAGDSSLIQIYGLFFILRCKKAQCFLY